MVDRRLNLPHIDLTVEGQRLPERVAQAFTSMRVHQHLNRPSVCELAFTGAADPAAQGLFRIGAELRVALREPGPPLFAGRISAVEVGYGSDRIGTLAVRAYDPLLALRNRGTARAFIELNALELAEQLTAGLGLTMDCSDPGPHWPRLLQLGSDFELLADVAARCGLYCFVEGSTLWLHPLSGRKDAAQLTLTLGDNLHEARFETNAQGAVRRVATTGWNPWRGAEHAAQADDPRVSRTLASAADIGGFDERRLPGRPVQGAEQAEAIVQAELDASSAQSLVLWATAAGDARLRPGIRVGIAGVAAGLTGPHALTSVRHTIDAEQGFRSELSSALPAPPVNAGGTLMTLGQVTRIDDPDHIGRVQVGMPAYGDIESDWLQVVAPGAGKAKGLIVQPDIGDLVLLLLDQADPAQAVVLGSLYGELGLPEDQGGLGRDASFCFVTPGGHRLRLDDGTQTVTLNGSRGSQLEMTPNHVTLRATAPMTIEAPGQRLTIRAKFIDFDRG